MEGKGNEALSQRVRSLYKEFVMDTADITDEEFNLFDTHNERKYEYESWIEYFNRQEKYRAIIYKIDVDYCFEISNLLHDCWKETYLRFNPPVNKHAGHELGPREFTLTYSPDWFDDEKARFLMKQAIERLCKYYDDDIVYLRAVGEKTKADRVHIHCYYELKGGLKITDKNMKRAYHKWDSKHHHHKLVRNSADFKGYIEKDLDTAWYTFEVDRRGGGM